MSQKMKVDMSPKAVKERLQTMNDLWLLSVKLMNSKKLGSANDKKIDSEKNLDQKKESRLN